MRVFIEKVYSIIFGDQEADQNTNYNSIPTYRHQALIVTITIVLTLSILILIIIKILRKIETL